MTDQATPPAEAATPQPELLESGRYAVRKAPDGGWIIGRAVNICDSCREHRCGEQADLIQIPAMVIQLAMRQGGGKILGMLKAAAGRG